MKLLSVGAIRLLWEGKREAHLHKRRIEGGKKNFIKKQSEFVRKKKQALLYLNPWIKVEMGEHLR